MQHVRLAARRLPMHALAACALLAAFGCGTNSEVLEADPSLARAQRQSYTLEPGPVLIEEAVVSVPAPFVRERLGSALAKELEDKGLEPAPKGESDLIVLYSATVRDRQEVVRDPSGPGAWRFVGRDVWVQEYREARLLIEMIDAQTGDIVWSSTASAMNEDFRDEDFVQDAVSEALEDFPPQATR